MFHLLGIAGPSTEGRAVEAGDDRNIDRGFGFANVIQIFLGPGVELAGVREIAEGFGKALGAGVEMEFQLQRFLVQLFFKQGIEHDGGSAGIFQAADSADFVRERGRRRDQRRS